MWELTDKEFRRKEGEFYELASADRFPMAVLLKLRLSGEQPRPRQIRTIAQIEPPVMWRSKLRLFHEEQDPIDGINCFQQFFHFIAGRIRQLRMLLQYVNSIPGFCRFHCYSCRIRSVSVHLIATISFCLPQSIREPCSRLRPTTQPSGNIFGQSLRRSRYQGKPQPTPNSFHNRWSGLRLSKDIFALGRYSSGSVPKFLHTESGRPGNMAMHGFQLPGQRNLLVRGCYLPALRLEQIIVNTSCLFSVLMILFKRTERMNVRIILSEVVPPPLHLTCFYHISALMYLHIGWRIHQKPRKERIWTDYKHKNHIRRICRALHGTISSERYPLLTFHHHDVISKTVQWSE